MSPGLVPRNAPIAAKDTLALRAFVLLVLIATEIWGSVRSVDVAALVQNSVWANDRDWQAAPGYDYLEQDRNEDGTKTYHVLMILGSPYEKLVAENGKPLPPDEQAQQQRKLEEAIAQRRNETPAQREERIAAYQKDRSRDHLLLSQLVRAFDFKLAGQQNMAGAAPTCWMRPRGPPTSHQPPRQRS